MSRRTRSRPGPLPEERNLAGKSATDPKKFLFRGLHPQVRIGTASDRYAGWIGQIYAADRYRDRIVRRKKTVARKTFTEEVLPVDSVSEYFDHFDILEIDFTFYRALRDASGKPTQNYGLLERYRQHLREDDLLLLKVPQVIFARTIPRRGSFVENEAYLDPEVFTRQFYEPAKEILGSALGGFIFEQAYLRTKERPNPEEFTEELDEFFGSIPRDDRYHVELRTASLLTDTYFSLIANYGIGQVLSHWTWLPTLLEQFSLSGRRFLNAGKQCIVRLLTPRGMRYEDSYAKAFPFDALVEDMMTGRMIDETAELLWSSIREGVRIDVIVNNRAGGNAPLIARRIAEAFLSR